MKNERLIKIRGSATRPEFARQVGVHKNTIARYESGVREPDGAYLRRLAELGWSPLWILTGLGEERLSPNAIPGAATDTALVVARGDKEAAQRRDETIRAMGPSHGLDPVALRTALGMVEDALQGLELAPALRAELIGHVYDLVVSPGELPSASITALVRAAAGEARNARQDHQDLRDPAGGRRAKGGGSSG